MIFESLILAGWIGGVNNSQFLDNKEFKFNVSGPFSTLEETVTPMFSNAILSDFIIDSDIKFVFNENNDNKTTIKSTIDVTKNLQRINTFANWKLLYARVDLEHKESTGLGGVCCNYDLPWKGPVLSSTIDYTVESVNAKGSLGVYVNKKLFENTLNVYGLGGVGYSFSNYDFDVTDNWNNDTYNLRYTNLTTMITNLEIGFNFNLFSKYVKGYGISFDFKIGMISYQEPEGLFRYLPIEVYNYVSGTLVFDAPMITLKIGINYYCMHPETPYEPQYREAFRTVIDESRLEVILAAGIRLEK